MFAAIDGEQVTTNRGLKGEHITQVLIRPPSTNRAAVSGAFPSSTNQNFSHVTFLVQVKPNGLVLSWRQFTPLSPQPPTCSSGSLLSWLASDHKVTATLFVDGLKLLNMLHIFSAPLLSTGLPCRHTSSTPKRFIDRLPHVSGGEAAQGRRGRTPAQTSALPLLVKSSNVAPCPDRRAHERASLYDCPYLRRHPISLYFSLNPGFVLPAYFLVPV